MDRIKKEIGLFDIFAITAGAMISSGLFVLPGIAYSNTGPAVFLAYAMAGLLCVPVLFSYAELSTAMPRSGGSYFVVDRSLGPVFGTMAGISQWLALILKSSFALYGIGAFSTLLFPNFGILQIKLIALFFCLVFLAFNIKGVKEATSLQNIMVAVMLGIIVLYVFEGFTNLNPINFQPFMPFGRLSILGTAGLVFISFAGLTGIVDMGEEIKNPGKNIPVGMFSAFLVVMTLYVLSVIVTVGMVPGNELIDNLTPLALGAKKSMGVWGEIILSLAALFSFATTANAGMMTASRTPLSMSRDGHLPDFFSRLSSQFNTPVNSLLITSAVMIFFILFVDMETFVKTASVVILVLFILMSLSLIVLRESRLYNYKPIFRTPFYPYIQIAGMLLHGALLFMLGVKPILMAGIFLTVGIVWYWLYSRIRVNRESALIHLMERFVDTPSDRDLAQGNLISELHDIMKERDDIVEDHFDRLVEHAEVLDMDEEISLKDFLKRVSEVFQDRLGIDREKLFASFIKREEEASSEILPGLAIPHAVIGGDCSLSLLMVRSRPGIDFSGHLVYAVFVFVGSANTRSLYLRSLVAITEIARQKDFMTYWLNAKSSDELKNIIMAGERSRIHQVFCLHCPEETLFGDRVKCKSAKTCPRREIKENRPAED